ncbi:MAG: sensor histidine kinase [Muribaculaceae bacterium]
MKKQTIWILTILMAVTFMGLLFMQIFYMRSMVQMRYDQFAQAARQSLLAVSVRLSHDETQYFLREDLDNVESKTIYGQYIGEPTPRLGGVRYSFTTSSGLEADVTIKGHPAEISNLQTTSPLLGLKTSTGAVSRRMSEQFMKQKNILDDIIVDIMYQASNRPIADRADSAKVVTYLRQELDTLGLNVPFEFAVVNNDGAPVYYSKGYKAGAADNEKMFKQVLFPHDGPARSYYLKVFFPTRKDFIYSTLPFIIPSFAFTLILLVVFVFTIITAFRQKKLTEMKNDFINNMTHEFKTPISSISLAAQMLQDPAVTKSPAMLSRVASVINSETRRLRFQVEKVLQMSMFEGRKSTLKLTDVDANSAIFNIANTFKLTVERFGGSIETHLDAMNAIVEVDEMHFTNVIFNLLDNAVKYSREDVPPHLVITSRDLESDRLQITVADNGIGISKEDQKRIFEKFFRVNTGNRHDVKGFGLGLAYVKKMITELGGDITVESHLNKGTKFIIILPLSKS